MTCCHRIFRKREKENKEGEKKRKREKNDLVCGQYTNANKLVQIERVRLKKQYMLIVPTFFNIKISYFLCS